MKKLMCSYRLANTRAAAGFFALTMGVTACGGVIVEPPAPNPAVRTEPAHPILGDGIALRDGWADSVGLRLVREEEEFFASPQSATWRLPAKAGCTVVSAVAARGLSDVDLAIWNSEGRLLARDISPDSRPTVQLCGEGAAHVRLDVIEGAGLVSVRFYDADAQVSLEAMGEGAESASWSGPSEPSTQERELRRRGFRQVDERMIVLSEESVSFPIEAPSGCFTLAVDSPVPLRLEGGSDGAGEGNHAQGEGTSTAIQWCGDGTHAGRLTPLGEAIEEPQRVRVRVYWSDAARVAGRNGLWLGDRSQPSNSRP